MSWAFLVTATMAQEVDEEEVPFVPLLPEWTEQEREALDSGDYVPGSSLMGRMALRMLLSEKQEVIELDPKVRELPEEEIEEDWTGILREEFLPLYYDEAPISFLNDPQELLTSQEFRDRQGFLDFHARDTEIDCYLYLFDEQQEVPRSRSLAGLVRRHFDQDKPVAVVFYYLGEPERTELAFTDRVIEALTPSKRDEVLRIAVEEAEAKSDPVSQLESFSVRLSIQLYWLEKVVARGGGSLVGGKKMLDLSEETLEEPKETFLQKLEKNESVVFGLVLAGFLIPAALLGWVGRWISKKRRCYVFPDAVGSAILDAPQAPGVGGVLSFSSAEAPPSLQKKEEPDYLQKI